MVEYQLLSRLFLFQVGVQSPGQHEGEHVEVSPERPKWVPERGRRVLFNEEVSGPGKTVGNERPEQGIPRMSHVESCDHHGYAKYGPRQMHIPVRGMAMCLHVEREEVFVTLEWSGLWHGQPLQGCYRKAQMNGARKMCGMVDR